MPVAVLFPGQGSQYVGMADPWVAHGSGRAVLEEVSALLGWDVVAGCRDEGALASTAFVQPALLACDLAAFRVLESEGVRPGAAAGHSLGEVVALAAAGVLDLADAVGIVAERGRAMDRAAAARPGTMTALLGLPLEEARALAEEARGEDVLVVANENAERQAVLSGSVPAVERVEAMARERGARAVRLRVAGAFHSPLMEPAVEPLRARVARARFHRPRFPVASNVSGALEDDPEVLRELLVRQVVAPVRWHAAMRALADAGFDAYLEAGPGDVLTKLARRAVPGATALAVGSPEAARAAAGAVSVAAGGDG
ncbi:MAG TPA: ACP S-malonyltransferase [Actinomycetota bacterium]|nr:ACP S-malonyltransferase [Actinomycetota bacterium]